jgi:hypothetical protein
MSDIISQAWMVYSTLHLDEEAAVHKLRLNAIAYFKRMKADPQATATDQEHLDGYIGWIEDKIEAPERRMERAREMTRIRVARWRKARKAKLPAKGRRRSHDGQFPAHALKRRRRSFGHYD